MSNPIVMLEIKMPDGETESSIYPILIKARQGYLFVDCGFVGSLPQIEDQLAQHGVPPAEIVGIVITHHDHDHMGAAAAFQRAHPGVKIYASRQEAPYISAEQKPLRLKQAEELQATLPPEQQAFGQAFCNLLRQVEPVKVDNILDDGDVLDWCGGCQVIATPGHTPGHISLFLKEQGIVIAGDAFVLGDGEPVIANPQFAFDREKAAASIDKLRNLGAKTMYCYHSGAYHP